jgi:hypothetical protein
METSASLLDRLKSAPEETDWQQLVQLYTPLIRSLLRRYLSSVQDADDVVQEILSVVIRKLPHFERERTGSLRSWLRSVSVNRANLQTFLSVINVMRLLGTIWHQSSSAGHLDATDAHGSIYNQQSQEFRGVSFDIRIGVVYLMRSSGEGALRVGIVFLMCSSFVNSYLTPHYTSGASGKFDPAIVMIRQYPTPVSLRPGLHRETQLDSLNYEGPHQTQRYLTTVHADHCAGIT